MKRKVIADSAQRSTKIRRMPAESTDVTANQVIKNLLALFERVGIDTPTNIAVIDSFEEERRPSSDIPPYSTIGELLTSWYQDPDYLDNAGNPVPIKLRGARRSFHILAQRVAPIVNSALLLSQLEHLGAVSIDKSKFIHVHMRSLPVYEDKRLAIQHTLTTLDGFIKTLHHNLDSIPSNSDQLFHRIAWTGNFDSEEIPALKIRMKRHGQHFLESFDNWLTLKSLSKSRSTRKKRKRTQVSVGVYLSVS